MKKPWIFGEIYFLVVFNLFAAELKEKSFPSQLLEIDGEVIQLERLVKEKTVVVVTLKAVWCAVCQEQLERIKERLKEFSDCNITFLVLAPGPKKGLKQIKERTGFPFPFVADEKLTISEKLSLKLNENEMIPGFLVLGRGLGIHWQQLGRSPQYFREKELLKFLKCSEWI